MMLCGKTNDRGLAPKGSIASTQASISALTSSGAEEHSEKLMWLNEWVPSSCGVLEPQILQIKSGAYQSGSFCTLEQGSCRYQSPVKRSFRRGLGISGWARPEAEGRHVSRNR